VTVNSLVNRSLRKLVDWDVHTDKFGMATLTPSLLIKLMDRWSLDDARALGREGARDSAKQAVELVRVDLTLPNLIQFLRRFGQYGGRFKFEEITEGGRHAVLIHHRTGLKWSAFYEGFLRGLFEDELGVKIDVEVSPDTCIAKFEL
jgi:hypothetical protein